MEPPASYLLTGNPPAAGHESSPSNPPHAHFYLMVRPYLKKGARHGDQDYLAQVLDAWSPQVDEENVIHEALFEAIYRGDELAVQMLLDVGVSPRRPERSDPQFTPLLAASQAGQLGMARRFWTLVGPEGRSDEDGISCLAVAARNGRPEIVAFFLDVWGDWTAKERKDALDGAAATRWDVCVDVLLGKLTYPQKDLQEALEWAIRKRMILMEDAVGYLRRGQLGVATQDEVEADARHRQRRVIGRLIDAGANPDGPGRWAKDGRLLLFAVSQLDYTACMATLLEKGANARIQNSQGETALHSLLRKGAADPDRHHVFQDTPQDRIVATRLLLDHGSSPDVTNEAGETALHLAAQKGSLEQLQLCLAHTRVAVNAVRQPNNQGESPLHYAAASGRDDVVEYLLAQGAADDVGLASRSGWTPLLCALSPSEGKSAAMAMRVCARLLARGASPRGVVTAEGWSPLHAVASWEWLPGPVPAADVPCAWRYHSSHRDNGPAAREQFVVRFGRELVRRGAPLDAEPAFLRHAAVEPIALRGVWGARMQTLAEKMSKSPTGQVGNAATEGLGEEAAAGGGSVVPDTTPLAWAKHTGAMDLVQVILDSLESGGEDKFT
ncbi:hypothetical protein PG990_000137 [Apiospora arundinis]